MVKGVGVASSQKKVRSVCIRDGFCSQFHFSRSDNSTSWEELSPVRRYPNPSCTVFACLRATRYLLAPSSGTTWRDNTRCVRCRARSWARTRFLRRPRTAWRTTVSYCATSRALSPSTCTRSTVPLPYAMPWAQCTRKWQAVTVQELRPSKSLRQVSFHRRISVAPRYRKCARSPLSSPRRTSASAHQWRASQRSSRPSDPLSSDESRVSSLDPQMS